MTHPGHEGEDVVLLVLDGVFRVLLFTFLGAAEPNRPGLQLLLPPTYVSQAVAAAETQVHRRLRRFSFKKWEPHRITSVL